MVHIHVFDTSTDPFDDPTVTDSPCKLFTFPWKTGKITLSSSQCDKGIQDRVTSKI